MRGFHRLSMRPSEKGQTKTETVLFSTRPLTSPPPQSRAQQFPNAHTSPLPTTPGICHTLTHARHSPPPIDIEHEQRSRGLLVEITSPLQRAQRRTRQHRPRGGVMITRHVAAVAVRTAVMIRGRGRRGRVGVVPACWVFLTFLGGQCRRGRGLLVVVRGDRRGGRHGRRRRRLHCEGWRGCSV